MNNRITALKSQCVVREQRGTNAFDSYMVDRFDSERFAELIVQDCVQTLVNHGYTDAATALTQEHCVPDHSWQKYQFPEIE
jgi:hypothetical protein